MKAREDFEKIFDPDRDDPEAYVDLFQDRVDGLWTKDFMWMLRAAILRDAVTAFDVYVEQGLNESLYRTSWLP